MEAISLTASVISITTLVVQICDSLKKAAEFWESFEDAPEDIQRISRELRLLANILITIRQRHESGLNQDGHERWIKEALELAKQDIDKLSDLVSGLARFIGPENRRMKRHWGQARIVIKRDRITKLRGYIESAKSILSLIQTSQTQSSMSQVNGRLEIIAASFQAITLDRPSDREVSPNCPESANIRATESKSVIGARPSPIPESISEPSCVIQTRTMQKALNVGLGVLSFQSTTKSWKACGDCDGKEDDSKRGRKFFTVRFLCRFASCRRGFRICTNDVFDNWTFNTIRRRPWDSEIFTLCRAGDIAGVRNLLDYGAASVFDYACRHGYPELCRLLIAHGADIYLLHDRNRAPATSINYYVTSENGSSSIAAAMLDVFIRDADLNPLDYWPGQYGVLVTHYGLLPGQIQYFLHRKDEFQFMTLGWLRFVKNQVAYSNSSTEAGNQSLFLLLSEYESVITQYEANPYHLCGPTLLWRLIYSLIYSRADLFCQISPNIMTKIGQVLKLTGDLTRWTAHGTILDTLALYNGGSGNRTLDLIREWLEVLRANGINLREYGLWEQKQHLAGLVNPPVPVACCRTIHVEFVFGESDNDLIVNIRNERNPAFLHLDSRYMCEAGRSRENCLSRIDDDYIRDGRPLPSLPGSWHESLKPNSELTPVIRAYGWTYVDRIQEEDMLWIDGWESFWDKIFKGSDDGRESDAKFSDDEKRNYGS